jgi:membrane protease YdiL (CAAX protease family)
MDSEREAPPLSAREVSRRRLLWLTAALIAVLVAWNNLIIDRLPAYPGSYVAANVAAAGLLLAAARWAGLTWDELGLAWRRVPAGLRWGGACFAIIAAGYAIALAIPGLHPLLTDERVGGMDGAAIAYRVLVHVPLGTVLWEEIAFRGVLLAAFTRLRSVWVATVASSAIFGLWHIRPAVTGVTANDLVNGPFLTTVAVLVACLASAAAGVVFTLLRLRSGSLIAPMLLHLATNSLGLLAAAAAFGLE